MLDGATTNHLFENSSCQAALAHEVFICHSVRKTRIVPWNLADQFFSGLMLCKIETCAKNCFGVSVGFVYGALQNSLCVTWQKKRVMCHKKIE